MTALSFRSARSLQPESPEELIELANTQKDVVSEEPDGEEVPSPGATRTLVLSPTKGLAEIVARGLSNDESLDVRHEMRALADLQADADSTSAVLDLIVFEIRAGNDADLAVLRELKAARGDGLKFLGIATEVMSLGTAQALINAGLSEVVPLSDVAPSTTQSQSLPEAVSEGTARTGQTLHNGMILAAIGARGGIGVTSFALNLATVLARPAKGRHAPPPPKVCVIDLDYQNGVLGAAIDVESTGTYFEFLQEGTLPSQAFVRQAMVRYEAGGFDVMAAPHAFAPLDALSPEMLASLLDELRLTYDFIVLDMPRALVDWVDAVLARADRLFILGDTNVHTVRQMRRMKNLYLDDHATLPMEFIISQEKRGLSSSAALKEAESFLEVKLSHWLPSDTRAARTAADHGAPMLLRSPRAKPAAAIQKLVDAIRVDFDGNRRRRA